MTVSQRRVREFCSEYLVWTLFYQIVVESMLTTQSIIEWNPFFHRLIFRFLLNKLCQAKLVYRLLASSSYPCSTVYDILFLGKVDASVNVKIHRSANRVLGDLKSVQEFGFPLPLELKTGRMFSKLGIALSFNSQYFMSYPPWYFKRYWYSSISFRLSLLLTTLRTLPISSRFTICLFICIERLTLGKTFSNLNWFAYNYILLVIVELFEIFATHCFSTIHIVNRLHHSWEIQTKMRISQIRAFLVAISNLEGQKSQISPFEILKPRPFLTVLRKEALHAGT